MSLEQLIEQDMIRFLDGEVKEPAVSVKPRYEDTALLFLNKDWSSEINRLLKRNDVEAAKRAFNELKQHYESIPESHPEEKKRTYGMLQDCYLLLVNFMQDKMRTTVLLRRMEQSPDDVFDFSVKPVDLQRVQQEGRIDIPELPQMTREMLSAGELHPLAQKQNIALPPPPASMGGFGVGGSASGGTGGGVPASAAPGVGVGSVQNAPTTPPHAATRFVAGARQALQHALAVGKTDPDHAAEILSKLRTDAQSAPVTEEIKHALSVRIDVLDAAVAAFREKREFAADFNKSYAAVAQLGRAHDGRAVDELDTLRKRVVQFDEQHPEYKGMFDAQLEKLKEQYALYSEDEILEKVIPLLAAVKDAAKQRSPNLFVHAVDEIERFAHHLPHTEHRDVLERAVQALRKKTVKREAPVSEDALLERLQPLLRGVKVAALQRDAVAYAAAVHAVADLVHKMPAGNNRITLEHMLLQLQTKQVILHG